MSWSDDQLRRAYQMATLRRDDADCPDEPTLQHLALGDPEQLDARRRERLVDHLVGCSDCARALQLLHAMAPWAHEATRVAGDAVASRQVMVITPPRQTTTRTVIPFPQRPAPGSRWTGLGGLSGGHGPLVAGAIAAVLLLVLALPVRERLVGWRHTDGGAQRGAPPAVNDVVPAAGASLAMPPELFSWPGAGADATYAIVLYDAEATPLWESPPLSQPSLRLPTDARRQIAAGGMYYWRVVTIRGLQRRSSPFHRFEVRAPTTP